MSLVSPTRGPWFLPKFYKWMFPKKPSKSKGRKENLYTNHDKGFRLHRPQSYIDYEEQVDVLRRANLRGADSEVDVLSNTLTPDAGDNIKVDELVDLSTILNAMLTTDDGLHKRIDKFSYDAEIFSTDFFKAYFYVIEAENGATFTAQTKNTSETATMRDMIDSGINTEYRLLPIGIVRGSHAALDSTNSDFRTQFKIDITKVCQEYVQRAEKAVYTGDTLPKLSLLMGGVSVANATGITLKAFRTIDSHDRIS